MAEQDPTVEKLTRLLAELRTHKSRLDAKAKEIETRSKNDPSDVKRELLALVADAFSEQVDTGLDFQVELIETIVEELRRSPPPGAEGDGEDIESGLDPEDADVILVALNGYRGMLEAYLSEIKGKEGVPAANVRDLELRHKQCLTAIELTEEVTFEEGDEGEGDAEPEDDDEDDAPDDGAGGATPTGNA